MHPRINELYEQIKGIAPSQILNEQMLYILKQYGATSTETIIVLHLGFNLNMSEVEDFVYKFKMWEIEDPSDTLFQTMKFMYYDKDPDYDADDDRVQISI